MLGIYLSGHPLDDYIDKFDSYNFTSEMIQSEQSDGEDISHEEDDDVQEIVYSSGITDGMNVSCGGIITEIKKVYTKNGNKEMCVLKIEDLYGNFEAMMFPAVY